MSKQGGSSLTQALKGQVILNTRPAHQQEKLSVLLEAQGAKVLSFPAIEIFAVESNPFSQGLAQNLSKYQILLFVSSNAVESAFRFFKFEDLAVDIQLGVIGQGTGQLLAEKLKAIKGAPIDKPTHKLIHCQPFNSEALLSSPELQVVEGKNILILRGQSGRNLLGDELTRRGAKVEYAEVYRREIPQVGSDVYQKLRSIKVPTLVVMTSNHGMFNLFEMLDDQMATELRQIPWLLISERMRESAIKLGHNADIIIAKSASDNGIQQTICQWANP